MNTFAATALETKLKNEFNPIYEAMNEVGCTAHAINPIVMSLLAALSNLREETYAKEPELFNPGSHTLADIIISPTADESDCELITDLDMSIDIPLDERSKTDEGDDTASKTSGPKRLCLASVIEKVG